jgi:hypothetical protein
MAQAQQAGEPNRGQPHKYKANKQAHVQNTKFGMGDNYGTGIKAKLGRVRGDTIGMIKIPKIGIKTPPTSVA